MLIHNDEGEVLYYRRVLIPKGKALERYPSVSTPKPISTTIIIKFLLECGTVVSAWIVALEIRLPQRPLNPVFEKHNLSFNVLSSEPFSERIFKTKFSRRIKKTPICATFGTRFMKIGQAMKVGLRSREMESQTHFSFLALPSLNARNRSFIFLMPKC